MRVQADWLTHPGSCAVFDALAGYSVWYVGGCVRNSLLGTDVVDIDLCTDALPETVVSCAETAGLKAIPTGIDHGTVTVLAHDRSFEITTLRRDIETDGRRASVAFTDQLAEDAARRDFTINALYATRSGEVVDPNGDGIRDLQYRRLRFIGDPGARIAEDYLRILRFFRFHAWYADPAGGMDAEALAACAAGLDGLPHVSRERIGAEVTKLLLAPDPAPAIAAMAHTGVLAVVLPGGCPERLTVLMGLEGNLSPDPIRRLAAIGGEDAETHLRLSRADAKRLALYRVEMGNTTPPAVLGYHHGLAAARDILTLRGTLVERPPDQVVFAQAKAGAQAQFPVKAADLPHLSGPALGQQLKVLEQNWIDSGFTLTKDDLLSR